MRNQEWKRWMVRALALGLAGSMAASTPSFAMGGMAGISAIQAGQSNSQEVTEAEASGETPAAAEVSETEVQSQPAEKENVAAAAEETKAVEEKKEPSPYENVAIARVARGVRVCIRSKATTDSSIVGYLENNGVADIKKVVEMDDGRWYKIESGGIAGYIKSDYFVTGEDAEAIAEQVATVKATVKPETLRLRSDADTDSSIVTLLDGDEEYKVLETTNGFAKLQVGSEVGYVDDLYVDYSLEFQHAISAEVVQEEKREAAAAARAEAAARAAREEEAVRYDEDDDEMVVYDDDDDDSSVYYDDDDDDDRVVYREDEDAVLYYEDEDLEYDDEDDDDVSAVSYREEEPEVVFDDDDEDYDEPEDSYEDEEADDMDDDPVEQVGGGESTSATRDAIVDYALAFVGEVPYVYGGNSLSSGVDCSGFVQQVFKHFGVSVPRDSGSQAGAGYGVSSSNKQPGDIICYDGHVGIYIGGGEVVHASNENSGVRVSAWNYRSVVGIRNVLD